MNNDQNQSTYDAIIGGAGPVGLFLACELALAKCSVLVLEKAKNPHSPLKQLPFGIRGLSAPTIEALYRRGLLQELEVHKRLKYPHQNAGQGPRRQVGHFAGIPFHDGDVDTSQWINRLPSSTDTGLLSEMEELESVLARRAEALGVEIKCGVAITDFQQSAEGVIVQPDEQSFQSKWLVGCDGARSVVRKAGGFEFAGTEPEFTGYSTKVDIADASMLRPGRNVTTRGMYLQSQPGYMVIQDFDGGAFHHSEKPSTLAHVQEVLRRISNTDVTIDALHIATTWTDRARQATTYRNGRVLLAGDAAHIHSPLGGQGLNTGIGDAMNLGWKLAATIQGWAPEDLLDTYTAERHPIGAWALEWTRAQVAIMRPDPHARAIASVIRDLMQTREGTSYFVGKMSGMLMRYNLPGDHALIGCSAPDFEFEDGTRLGDLLHQGKGVLLDLADTKELHALRGGWKARLHYVSTKAKDSKGVAAMLVRPDGFVAWDTDSEPDEQSVRHAADLWFMRASVAKEAR